MNFLSFSNVSQLQANTQLINEHINQAHSQEASQQKEIDFDSPILHKRTHSESSFPAIFSPGRIDQICQLS